MRKCVLRVFYNDATGSARVVGQDFAKTYDIRFSVDKVKDDISFYLASLK